MPRISGETRVRIFSFSRDVKCIIYGCSSYVLLLSCGSEGAVLLLSWHRIMLQLICIRERLYEHHATECHFMWVFPIVFYSKILFFLIYSYLRLFFPLIFVSSVYKLQSGNSLLDWYLSPNRQMCLVLIFFLILSKLCYSC